MPANDRVTVRYASPISLATRIGAGPSGPGFRSWLFRKEATIGLSSGGGPKLSAGRRREARKRIPAAPHMAATITGDRLCTPAATETTNKVAAEVRAAI